MLINKHLGCVIALMSLAVGPAHADGYREPKASPISASWSGPYVGVQAGGTWAEADYHRDYGPRFPEYAGQPDLDIKDWAVGGKFGLQQQFNSVVVGIEAWGLAGDFEQTAAPFGPAVDPDFSNETISIDSIVTLTGRLGFILGTDWLAYAKGGYALADVENRLDTRNGNLRSKARENGWVVGGGIDYRIAPHVLLGAEYNYIDLDLDDRHYAFPNQDPADLVDGDIALQTASISLTFLLNGESETAPPK